MRLTLTTLLILTLAARAGVAQVGGNVGYGQAGGRARAEQNERAKRQLTREEMPPTATTMFIDANVLINVKADEFVATFGVAEEAETVEACQAKMDATIAALTEALKPLGVGPEALFVDFAAQTKVYGYKVEGSVAREHLAGIELKKTVAVRYRDKALIDRLVVAASRAKVHDLIKVDHVVTGLAPIQERLAEAAAAVIKAKVVRHERLLGIKLRAVPQVYAERSSAYFPTEMYDSYTAGESEAVSGGPDRSRTTVQSLRKSRKFPSARELVRDKTKSTQDGRSVFRVSSSGGVTFATRSIKRHARWFPIVAVWRHTVRATDGLQTTITCGPVNVIDQECSLQLALEISLPMPLQDEHLPEQIESSVHQAGLEFQRRLFQVLIEMADHELVLQQRHGKAHAGIQRKGTRPFTFKTIFGEVTVERSRILHKNEGTIEVPSAVAWKTSHQRMITRNLRDAVCDQMGDQSARRSRADLCEYAGDDDLLGPSTIIDIVHQEGERLLAAQRQRARAVLSEASSAQLALLGPTAADPDALTGLVDDAPPLRTRRKPGPSGNRSRPSGSRPASPGASRRSRWTRVSPAWWTRDS